MVVNPFRRIHQARIGKWPLAHATVDSCSWIEERDNLGIVSGHYHVSFMYKSEGSVEPHRGCFSYPGCREVAPYSVGESLTIQYNPKKPGRYTFRGADSNYEKLEAILVMALFGLVAGYVLFTF